LTPRHPNIQSGVEPPHSKKENLTSVTSMMDATLPITKSTLHLGDLQLASRFWLSPLAGYTNLPFRLVVRELGGVGLATTDLVNARALLVRSRKTMELIDTCPQDRPLAVQIYGANAQEMSEAARWLESYGVSVIDINMGCPVHKVVRGGGGSAMMCHVGSAVSLVRSVVEAVRIPVTVKMRLGWDDQNWTAPELAREFEQAGVAGVIIHGRTREQGFGGSVKRDGIRAVVEAVERMPVIGNGDIRSVADAEQMLAHTGCAGVSIGRGALLNPWFFVQLQRWEQGLPPAAPPTYDQRLTVMSRHFHLLARLRGERSACLTFRKMSAWYCKVLRPGREIQKRLIMLESVAAFDTIMTELRDRGEPPHWPHHGIGVDAIAVPKGPISHW
jgi:nifR3 family TIM-barrel protein